MNPMVELVKPNVCQYSEADWKEFLRWCLRVRPNRWQRLSDWLGISNGHGEKFDIDLADASLAEQLVQHIASGATIEVKAQPAASKTRNVFIEYACRNRPSGIMVTQADWFALPLGGADFRFEVIPLMKTSRLLVLCQKYGHRTNGGDGGVAQGWLLSTSKLVGALRKEPVGAASVQAAMF